MRDNLVARVDVIQYIAIKTRNIVFRIIFKLYQTSEVFSC